MTDRLVKLIQDNPERFKGVLDDLIIAYEGYIDEIKMGTGISDSSDQISEVQSDIEFVKQIKSAVL